MNQKTCPFLGMKDDPSTALDFPSPGNFCHHARPIRPVKGSYQERVCLTGEHITCPLYRAAQPLPMPAQIAGDNPERVLSRRTIALLAIPALLAGAAALTLAWNTFGMRSNAQARLVPGTGAETQTPFAWSVVTGTPLALSSPTSQSTLNGQPTVCPIPTGWVAYTVTPTDSLFRLSVIYGVTIDELQDVNCMGNKTVILPGQVIYVPFLPTRTPSSTPTRIPFVPSSTSAPREDPRATNTEAPPDGNPERPTDTVVPPTQAPQPTQPPIQPTLPPVQPTQPPVQPTQAPVQPTPPPPPPPTREPEPTREPRPTKEPKPTKPPKDQGDTVNDSISFIEDLIQRLYPEGLP